VKTPLGPEEEIANEGSKGGLEGLEGDEGATDEGSEGIAGGNEAGIVIVKFVPSAESSR
jgi:hypothetical protein